MKNFFVVFALVAAASVASAAETWYVDNTIGNVTYDGTSATVVDGHGPKARIQDAIELANDGDTVVVAPGVYGDDQDSVACDASHAACRVYIKKNITLKSSGGRDVTHIVGKFDYEADASTGVGPNAVGGVVFAKDAAKGATLKGFTIRDCADSKTSNNSDSKGTAVFYAGNAAAAMADMPWVTDCAISNISASCAALAYVNVARTSVMNCKSVGLPYVADYCNLAYCIVAHCYQSTNMHCIRGTRTGDKANFIVNCTFVDLSNNLTSTTCPGSIDNSISDKGGIFSVTIDGCVLGSGRSDIGNADRPINSACTNEATSTCRFSTVDGVVAGKVINDFRLPNTSLAVNRGLADKLLRLPEAHRYVDFNGNPVTVANGHLHAGAVQTVFEPTASFKIAANGYYLRLNGLLPAVNSGANRSYTIFASDWPVAFDLRMMNKDEITAAGATKPFFAYYVSGGPQLNRWVFPDSDERLVFVPAKGETITIEPRLATDVCYVDAAKEVGVANTGTGTEADPFARIQQAINKGDNKNASYHLIYVAPGTYAAERTARPVPNPDARVYINKAAAAWRLIGTGGAENTIIPGADDPDAPAGYEGCCSTNAVRCLETTSASVSFQGFTLTGGRTACAGERMDNGNLIGSGNSYGRGGAIWANDCDRPWLVECIVSNNVAYYNGGSMANGHAVKCLFADNRSVDKDTLIDTQNTGRLILMGCVVDEQAGRQSGGYLLGSSANLIAVNCTFVGNKNVYPFQQASGHFYNCLFAQWKNLTAVGGSKRMKGCLFHDFTLDATQGNNKPNVNFVTGDPLFADADAGDFRVRSDSPAVGGGAAWGGLDGSWTESVAYSNYYRNLTTDYLGNLPHLVGGLPTIGAYQVPSQARIETSVDHEGEATVTASATVDWDTSVTVTTQDGARQVLGLKVNGAFREGVKSVTLVPQVADAVKTYSVEAVLNTDWYVDAVHGDDANTGWTASSAMKTLAGVMAKAASGDTVHALPGTYAEGSMKQTEVVYWFKEETVTIDDVKLRSRVVVPAGVRLVSTDGAAATVIRGEFAATANKLGDGAMRAVFLGKGASLGGFTVTGGSTLEGTIEYQHEIFDNVSAGGILCADTNGGGTVGYPGEIKGLVENCVVSNNYGCGTSAAHLGSYVHCLFTENHGAAYVVREPQWLYGCVVDNNTAKNNGVYQPVNADFCTFGTVLSEEDGGASQKTPVYSFPNTAIWPVRNCLFTGGKGSCVKWAFNCRGTWDGYLYDRNPSQPLSKWENCTFDGTIAVDANWRPVLGCGAVDAAVDPMTSVTNVFRYAIDPKLLRETDFAGGQRVYNGVQDVGAGEADWRGRFGRDIGRRVTVNVASPTVVENGQLVDITDGEMELVWQNPTGDDKTNAEMTFEVKGDGTLTLTIGDTTETYTKADGKVERPCVLPAQSETAIRFSYAAADNDTTGVVIGPFKAPSGLLLFVR